MKNLNLILAATATTLVASTLALAAEPVEQTVALRIGESRYATAAPKGGLNTKSSKITANATFVLVDLNGEELADGDKVQIRWDANTKPTYWGEGEGTIGRYGGKPGESKTFVVKLQENADKAAPKSIALQTASGKWVSLPTKGGAFATTDKEDEAATLTIEKIEKTEATTEKDAE